MERAKERAIKVFNLRYLPLFAAYLILGIFCIKLSYLAAAIVGIVAVLSLLALFFTKSLKWGVVIALLCFFCLGYGLATLELHLRNDVGLSGSVRITCRVIQAEEQEDLYYVRADEIRSGGKSYGGEVTFSVQGPVSVGDRMTVNGVISINKVSLQNVNTALRYRKGAKYQMQAEDYTAESGSPPLDYTIKNKVNEVLIRSQGEDAGGFSYAALFGDTEYMDKADKKAMQNAGVAHVLAVSGLHVSVLAAALLFLLRKLGVKEKYLLCFLLPVLGFYAYLAGFTPSVLRASIMTILALIASALGERYDSLSAVSFTAVLLLLVRPLWLFDISFLLSFLCILGIDSLASPLERAFRRKKMGKRVASGLALSIAATLAVLPISAVVFGRISLVGFALNLIVVPLASISYVLNLIAILLTLLIPSFGKVLEAVNFLPKTISELSVKAAALGWTARYDFSVAEIAVYYAVLLFVGKYSLAKKKVKLVAGGMGAGVLTLLLLL